MTRLRWQPHQLNCWCTAVSISVTNKSLHLSLPLSPFQLIYTVQVCGIWHDRTHHCRQITPKENCLKRSLHRWLIENVVILVLFSFTFTWNRTTTESINSHTLQDLLPSAWYQLTSMARSGEVWQGLTTPGEVSEVPMTAVLRQPRSQPHRKELGVLRFWGAMRFPDAWHEAGTQPLYQNKDHNSSSTPRLPREDKHSNCAVSSKPSGTSQVFRKLCLSLIRDLSKKPKPPKLKKQTTKKRNPKETEKQKKPRNLFSPTDQCFCQTAMAPLSQRTMLSHLAQDQTHDITLSEQVLATLM